MSRSAAKGRPDGDAEIAIVTLATGEVRRLTERAGNDLAPTWSPDDRTLAFGGEPDGTGNWDVWTVDLASGALTRRTTAPPFDGAPMWVPAAVLGR